MEEYLKIKQRKLLILIGSLGILLPILIFLINNIFASLDIFNNETFFCLDDCNYQPQRYISSISHSYYTPAYPVFVGIIISFAVILFSYKGYPKGTNWISDNMLTNLAGFCAVVLVVLPTSLAKKRHSLQRT